MANFVKYSQNIVEAKTPGTIGRALERLLLTVCRGEVKTASSEPF